MNRLAFLLVPAVALVASLAPAHRDISADRTERVRFSHQRHDRWLPDCAFCHRRVAPEADGNPTPWLEFARPSEASCICHRLPTAPPPPRGPESADTPFAPPPTPGGVLEAGAKQADAPSAAAPVLDEPAPNAADVPTPLALPADEASAGDGEAVEPEVRGEDPDATSEPSSSVAPMPHPVAGMESCSTCHATGGPVPWPADHEGWTNETCTMCHTPPVEPPPVEPPPPPPPPASFVPHVVEGLGECTSCHRARGLRPIPADHADFANDTCTACHLVVPRPQSVAAREGPDAPVCALCHPVDRRQRLALPALVEPPGSGLVFSHAAHEAAAPTSCETCHSPAQADARRPPSMQVCMSCHSDAMSRCARCHEADARGRLVTDLPDGRRLVPPTWWGAVAHLEEWDREHDVAARTDGAMCRNCHEQPFCEGCHLGLSTERRFHGAGWLTLHGPAGRSSDLTCDTCHDRQGTCLACHRRAGVAADSPDDAVPAGAGRYHPSDWTFSAAGHPREARRNLGACVSCHSEGHCFTCHRGINPHGESFFGGPCNLIRRSNRGLCLECHATVPRCNE